MCMLEWMNDVTWLMIRLIPNKSFEHKLSQLGLPALMRANRSMRRAPRGAP